MLGITLLSEIAFTASLKVGAFQIPGYEDDVKKLWRHSLATGAFAKEVARVKRMNVESAYLCGLLHEIGKPVVLRITTTIARDPKTIGAKHWPPYWIANLTSKLWSRATIPRWAF